MLFKGIVHGGQQPVTGSQITAYAAGNGGFGSNAVALACTQTNAAGSFSFGGPGAVSCGGALTTSFSCPSSSCPSASTQIYLIASGGNPGLAAGTNNSALVEMVALGPYSSISASTFVDITELTTVAAVYAMAQMMGTDSGGCVNCGGGLAARLQAAQDINAKSPWLDLAAARAGSLVNLSSSAPGTALPAAVTCTGASSDPVNCGAEEKLDSVANALAACVNTAGPTSSACKALFCDATAGATVSGGSCTPPAGGAVPTDTLQSALSIALNPGRVPAGGVFDLAGATPPFTPVLASAPGDWTLALNFTGGGLGQSSDAEGLAIDADGDVWVANYANVGGGSVTELGNDGVPLSPSSGYIEAGTVAPGSIAIDASGNVWTSNAVYTSFGETGYIAELNRYGAPLSPSGGYTGGGVVGPYSVAIDPNGHIWTIDSGTFAISELSGTGAGLSPSSGFTSSGIVEPAQLAIDASGNVWGAARDNGVFELSPSGAVLSPPSGYTGGGLDDPNHIAIDASGNIWLSNYGFPDVSTVSEFSSEGVALSPPGGYVSTDKTESGAIAVDGGGNIWVVNTPDSGDGSVTELNNSGALLSPLAGYTGGGLSYPVGLGIDSVGNVWISNTTGSVVELVGAAVPVKTPLIGPPQTP